MIRNEMTVFGYRKQFWFIAVPAVLLLLLGGGGFGIYLVRYSATGRAVCRQCHPEHIELWENSNGHPSESTSCHECHSEGRRVIPSDWNVFRHVRDQIAPPEYSADDTLTTRRCLDCHEEVLEIGYEIKKKVINFTHRIHIEEALECIDCHRTSGHHTMDESTNRPTINECVDCHIKDFTGPPKNRKCLSCHDVMLVPGKAMP